jgi:hypothetical protein
MQSLKIGTGVFMNQYGVIVQECICLPIEFDARGRWRLAASLGHEQAENSRISGAIRDPGYGCVAMNVFRSRAVGYKTGSLIQLLAFLASS